MQLSAKSPFLQKLPPGALDIIGDVHGEIEPLRRLLTALGYDENGDHADGRTMVFVGDLADRGPDSPAVAMLVRDLWQRGRALCIVGNHELNLLRGDAKDGNGWAFADNHDRRRSKYLHSRDALEHERVSIADFFRRLPLALYRDDLRIVHACWHDESFAQIAQTRTTELDALFEHFESRVNTDLHALGLLDQVRMEQEAYPISDPSIVPPLLDATARADELRQMGNPLRVITSGIERYGRTPFFSSGKWRMVDRIPWWAEYVDERPVVIGHYWRWPTAVDRGVFEKDGPDLFAGTHASDWLGPQRNVFCVDFSIGRRFRERELGYDEGSCAKLGALRWPERELVFDSGEVHTTG